PRGRAVAFLPDHAARPRRACGGDGAPRSARASCARAARLRIAAPHARTAARMTTDDLRVRLARGMHRVLRRLAPTHVRRLHDADLAETFDDLAREAAGRGWLATAGLLVHEAVDLVRARRLASRGASHSDERNVMTSLLVTLVDWRTIGRSIRALWRRPAFAATAVLTLGLGSAATTALF